MQVSVCKVPLKGAYVYCQLSPFQPSISLLSNFAFIKKKLHYRCSPSIVWRCLHKVKGFMFLIVLTLQMEIFYWTSLCIILWTFPKNSPCIQYISIWRLQKNAMQPVALNSHFTCKFTASMQQCMLHSDFSEFKTHPISKSTLFNLP